jgi:hypothetical protein
MVEGQKAKLLGRRMNPRGKQRLNRQKEVNKLAENVTAEGQQESLIDPVSEAEEGDKTPDHLDPENGQSQAETGNDVETHGQPSLAHDLDLQAALSESEEVVDAEFEELPQTEPIMSTGVGPEKAVIAITRDGKQITLGVQPDGSEKFVISVQEGYPEPVRQWAEAVGVSVERWLEDRLYEIISSYGEPARRK